MASPQESSSAIPRWTRRELLGRMRNRPKKKTPPPEGVYRFHPPPGMEPGPPETRRQFLQQVPRRLGRGRHAFKEFVNVEPITSGPIIAAIGSDRGEVARLVIKDGHFGFVEIPFLMRSRVEVNGRSVDPAAFASREADLPRPNTNTAAAEGGVVVMGVAPENVKASPISGVVWGPVNRSGPNPGIIIEPRPSLGDDNKLIFPLAGSQIMVNGKEENGPDILDAIQRGEYNGQTLIACAWPLRYQDGTYAAAVTGFVGIGEPSIAYCPLGSANNWRRPQQLFPAETIEVHLASKIAVNPNFYLSLVGR